jgi:hypothetical protein
LAAEKSISAKNIFLAPASANETGAFGSARATRADANPRLSPLTAVVVAARRQVRSPGAKIAVGGSQIHHRD